MKSLRISTDCQKILDNPNTKGPFYAGALVGQVSFILSLNSNLSTA